MAMTLNEMRDKAHATSKAKGWHDTTDEYKPATPGEHFALQHSEISEALEAYRDRGLEAWLREDGKPEGVAAELADVIIRIGDFAGKVGIDLDKAVADKMAFNDTRSHRHGGKRL